MLSYTHGAMLKAEQNDTITPEGTAWLAGWRAAENHIGYVEAYGGDLNEPGTPPGMAPGLKEEDWHAGWVACIADDNENHEGA